jgi:heme-degrading monooxygenase HmoA
MSIKVIVEFQAKPGVRTELKEMLANISRTHGPQIPGFLGSTVYEVIDSPDGLVEIADWDSADAQQAAVQQAMDAGLYTPLTELVAAPFRATRISHP